MTRRASLLGLVALVGPSACADEPPVPTAAGFCAAYAAVDASGLAAGTGDEAPADLERLVEDARPLFADLAAAAPPDVAAPAAALGDSFEVVADYLASVDFELARLAEAPPEVVAALEGLGAVDDPSSPLATYVATNCDG